MSIVESEFVNEHGQTAIERCFVISDIQYGQYTDHVCCSIFNDIRSFLKTSAHHFTISTLKTTEHNRIIRTNFILTGPYEWEAINKTTSHLERIYFENIQFFNNNIRIIELMEPETQHEFELTLIELCHRNRETPAIVCEPGSKL